MTFLTSEVRPVLFLEQMNLQLSY